MRTGSRFWWRALDAQSPEPGLSKPQPRPMLRPYAPRAGKAPLPNFTLRVPRSDQRFRRRRKPSRVSALALIFAGFAALAGSGVIVAATFSGLTVRDVQTAMRLRATDAMIALGFGIEQVSLTGQRYTLDSDVYDALDLANVRTFAELDTAAALKRIERISWVDTAQITRVFPGMLAVEITERTPAAIWRRGDKTYLIDATGRTLGPVQKDNIWALPEVAGEGANGEAPLLLAALTRHGDIKKQFAVAERIAERRWSVVLRNGSRIELAADREVEGLDNVASNGTLRKALTGMAMIVDVRTPGRAVVRPASSRAAAFSPGVRTAGGALP